MKQYLLIPVSGLALLMGLALSTTTVADHGGKGGGYHKAEWKESLTKKQQDAIDRMKVDYLKQKYPLKAKIKTIKIELAVLATADKPDQKAIDAKIDELLALKKEKMKAKYAYIMAVRKQLTPEQQVLYDKYQLKKAKRKKCAGHGGYGHHGDGGHHGGRGHHDGGEYHGGRHHGDGEHHGGMHHGDR